MRTHDYSVTIRPKDKSAADEYTHKGKTYIEGRHNSAYVIDLINHTGNRVEAVVSVDGLAITDGKPASYHSKGFVVAAHETATLKGWIVNDTQAAQFVFGDKLDSYSNRGGSHTQTGIIGVAWFPEKIVRVAPTLTYNQTKHMWNPNTPVTPMWSVQNICDPDQTLGAQVLRGSIIGATMGATESKQVASAANAQQTSLGTQFGESVSYPTTPTAFERTSSEPQCVSMIYYDHAQNLIRMGIKLKPRTLPYADAFPGNNVSYCEPPPGWTHKKW